jgi:hypothetical protein
MGKEDHSGRMGPNRTKSLTEKCRKTWKRSRKKRWKKFEGRLRNLFSRLNKFRWRSWKCLKNSRKFIKRGKKRLKI